MRKLRFLQTLLGFFKQKRPTFAAMPVDRKPRRSSASEAERLDRLRNPSKYLGMDSDQLPGPAGPENRSS
jgi:hypothetical protein